MRRANGTGCVIDKGKHRRIRYWVRITIGWDDNGKQICKYLGGYEKRADATQALAQYLAEPWNIEGSTLTFSEVWEMASKEVFSESKSNSTIASYKTAFNHCSQIHNMKMKEIRTVHLQNVLDSSSVRSKASLNNMLVVIHYVMTFAMQNDYIRKDYSQYVKIRNTTAVKERTIFTENEISEMWKDTSDDNIKITLILLYTGFRINELLTLTQSNINLSENYIQGGLKTSAGKNRIVPIHNRIKPLLEHFFKNGNKLFANIKYPNYNNFLTNYCNHKPHDTRHTFATLLQKYGAKQIWIDKIIGHSSGNLTNDLYTHADLEELIKTIHLLP